MHLTAAGRSDRGPRAANQDAFLCDLDLGLLAVADGMGGHNAGEVASRIAIESVAGFLRMTRDARDITWPFGFDPAQSTAANRLNAAIRLANRTVHEAGTKDAKLAGMGTTLVAILVEKKRAIVAHVGDSRAYWFHQRVLERMTRDDTWLMSMLGIDSQSPEGADHPMRHVLTSGIGMRPDVTPSVIEHPLTVGDRWLLCSDGVHGVVDDGVIEAALRDETSAEAAAAAVVREAIDRATTDNATAIVLRVD